MKIGNARTDSKFRFSIIIFTILIFSLTISTSYQYASATVYDGTKAAVSIIFHHAESNQLTAINNEMYDMDSIIAVIAQRVGASDYMTQQQLLDLQSNGHEIVSHSETHATISSSTSPSTLYYETVQSKIDLENMGFEIFGFIPPRNDVTTESFALIQSNYEWTEFFSPITYRPKYVTPEVLDYSKSTYDLYHLPAWGIGNGDTLKSFLDVKAQLDYAIANKYWIAFNVHSIETGSDTYSISPTIFHDIMQYVRQQRDAGNLDVITMAQGVGLGNPNLIPPVTTAFPSGGTYNTTQLVTLTANEPATIYYTTNGDTPTTSSTVYTAPIQITDTTTLKFFAKDADGNTESVKTLTYTILDSPITPILFDNSKNNSSTLCNAIVCSISLTVGFSNDRMIIVTITDEGTLNPVTSVDITGGTNQGILVGKRQVGSGSTQQNVEMWRIMESDIADGANTITVHFTSAVSGAGISVMSFSGVKQQPEEAENSNVITSNTSITVPITTLSDGALIVSVVGNGEGSGTYTSHGAGQSERNDFGITSAWNAVTTEIKSTAGLDNQSHTFSKIANRHAQYVASFAPATESADLPPITTAFPSGGTYNTTQLVTLTANEPATIYYTTNGDTPTTSSSIYTTAIPMSTTTTLKFFAKDTVGNEEAVKTTLYTINDVSAPTTIASPIAGTYTSAQSVTLTANEPSTIYYTTNGATPTTSSPVYSSAIMISSTTTLKYFAKDIAGNEEAVKTASYTITSFVPVTHMSDTTASSGDKTHSGRQIQAEYVSPTSQLVGDNIDSITMRLKKTNSPTGIAQIGVFNTDLSIKQLFGTVDASKLSTSYTDITFSLPPGQTYQIQSGDRIGIKFTGGNETDRISTMRDTSSADPFDGTKSYHTYFTTIWQSNTGYDLYMILRQSTP